MHLRNEPLISTIADQCRKCYTCVRECPAKAIRISSGRAEVLPERCVGCGNCVQVCSQSAKKVASDLDVVRELLESGQRVAATVAPSFPAEFPEYEPEQFIGLVRALGFELVTEVAFGADLVALAYRKLLTEDPTARWVETACPAVVGYVQRFQPELVDRLAPLVSPMIASGRVIHRIHGEDVRVVFIGPCIAKKAEAREPEVAGAIDAVITFKELRELLSSSAMDMETVETSDFDPPHAGTGALYPISRGMLQAANLHEDLIAGDVVSAEGRHEFAESLREFSTGDLNVRLLQVLACSGCTMGPGMTTTAPHFRRRARISQYVRKRLADVDLAAARWQAERLADLPLHRNFSANDQRMSEPTEAEIHKVLQRVGKFRPEDELNCGACGYPTCREHAIAVLKGLAETEMCLPFAVDRLAKMNRDLRVSNSRLASTQEALMQAEKLASMGQLAAGVAHEVNNPLSTVVMLAHVLMDETAQDDPDREDLTLIASEADRCKTIVSNLLQFARRNKVNAAEVDLRELTARVVRTFQCPPGVEIEVEQERVNATAEVDQDQVIQVLTNLLDNAAAAMPNGGTITIALGGDQEHVRFAVADTGTGIPKGLRNKVFEPFMTTKKSGEGTGLGLAVIYGIVKMHRGNIRLETNDDPTEGPTGTTFMVELPRERRVDSEHEEDVPCPAAMPGEELIG